MTGEKQDNLTEAILSEEDRGILKVTHPDHGDDTVIDGTAMAGENRSGSGLKVLLINILCNLILFAGKLIAGIVMKSAAVTADAFNNLTDTVSNIIGIIGIRLAEEPADRTHPFGHGRIEYLTSFILDIFYNVSYWDYHDMFMNVNGRICIAGLLAFGLGGLFGIYLAAPKVHEYMNKLSRRTQITICAILCALFLSDVAFALINGFNSGVGVGEKL